MITRGVRNNNPFNVCRSSSRWLGLVPRYQVSDFRFCQFVDMKYGIRCGLVLLRKYIQVYKLSDVRSIISRFAPEAENDTQKYIEFVEDYMSKRGYTPYDLEFGSDKFYVMCQAILEYESRYVCELDYLKSVSNYFGLC